MHIEGIGRRYARWLLALALGGCGGADPPVVDPPADRTPVYGPWSCTREGYCYEYTWIPRWEYSSQAGGCPRWAAARCAPADPTGLPFFGRCSWPVGTTYTSPRATVVYGRREADRAASRSDCNDGGGAWSDTY